MDSTKAEAIARITCDIGMEHVFVRPITHRGWGIFHLVGINSVEIVYSADTKEECYELLRLCKEKREGNS